MNDDDAALVSKLRCHNCHFNEEWCDKAAARISYLLEAEADGDKIIAEKDAKIARLRKQLAKAQASLDEPCP